MTASTPWVGIDSGLCFGNILLCYCACYFSVAECMQKCWKSSYCSSTRKILCTVTVESLASQAFVIDPSVLHALVLRVDMYVLIVVHQFCSLSFCMQEVYVRLDGWIVVDYCTLMCWIPGVVLLSKAIPSWPACSYFNTDSRVQCCFLMSSIPC